MSENGKLNASIVLKNRSDKHLNVFWQYDGKPELENNITKAFINTFDSLDYESKLIVVDELFGIKLEKENKYEFSYGLQHDPDDETNRIIKSVDDNNKVLFAFSPTGKCRGEIDGIDKADEEAIRESLTKKIINEYPNITYPKLKEKVNDKLKVVLQNIEDRRQHDAQPDAWIFIRLDNCKSPKYIIAFENKLWDLDPYQLDNHCTNALHIKTNDRTNIIKKSEYEKILKVLSRFINTNYLSGEFIRYMYFMNYWAVDSVSQIEGMDKEHVKFYSKPICFEILKTIAGSDKVEWHPNWMFKIESEQAEKYGIGETGIGYNDEKDAFEVVIVFASTQHNGDIFYSNIKFNDSYLSKDVEGISISLCSGFHLNKGNRGNISESYSDAVMDDIDAIKKYIEFWSCHNSYLKNNGSYKKKTDFIKKLIEEMKKEGIILDDHYNKIKNCISERKLEDEKVVGVCPELTVRIEISREKAIELDKTGALEDTIKKNIENIYDVFGLNHESWM